MTAPMFFKQLRKTTALLIVVFVVFAVHRLVIFLSPEEKTVATEETVDLLETAESVVCHNIVGGAAFGVDSVFNENTRLYFYSVLDNAKDSTKTYQHKWFNGLDTVLVSECKRTGNICLSSISPRELTPGEWSVDLVDGKRILNSKQFFVESSKF